MLYAVKNKGNAIMVDIFNKANFFQKHGLEVDITKPKDVLGKETVKVRDILNNKDAKINKTTDIFPKTDKTDDNEFLG